MFEARRRNLKRRRNITKKNVDFYFVGGWTSLFYQNPSVIFRIKDEKDEGEIGHANDFSEVKEGT